MHLSPCSKNLQLRALLAVSILPSVSFLPYNNGNILRQILVTVLFHPQICWYASKKDNSSLNNQNVIILAPRKKVIFSNIIK